MPPAVKGTLVVAAKGTLAGAGGGAGFVVGAPPSGGTPVNYGDINQAILLQPFSEFPTTLVAGTTDGIAVGGATWPVTDDALNGAYLVLNDPTPGNGLAAQYARIIDYVGATKTATLDRPYNLGVGETAIAVFPQKVLANAPFPNDVITISTKPIVLDLGGGEVKRINITGGSYVEIRNGTVRDGIFKSTATRAPLVLLQIKASRREGTSYALLIDETTNVGATELYDCEFYGLVAGRQGICRWIIEDCFNPGIADGDGNVPYRLLEASGIARVFSNVDIDWKGHGQGAIFFTKGAAGAITSAAPNFLRIDGNLTAFSEDGTSVPATTFALLKAIGASSAAISALVGEINLALPPDSTDSIIECRDFVTPGVVTLTLSLTFVAIDCRDADDCYGILTTGATAFTGAVTLAGASGPSMLCENAFFSVIGVKSSAPSGTMTVSAASLACWDALQAGIITYFADQTVGPGATKTVSADLFFDYVGDLFSTPAAVGVASIAFAIDTISSLVTVNGCAALDRQLASVWSGGSVTISGIWRVSFSAGYGGALRIARHGGTGGTLTVSAAFFGKGGFFAFPQTCHAIGAGATVVRTGAVTLSDQKYDLGFAVNFAMTATSTATGSGGVTFVNCIMQATGIVIANSLLVGSSVTVPTFTNWRYCIFEGTFALRSGVGTFLGSCTVRMAFCKVDGAFTIRGTNFPSLFIDICSFIAAPAALIFDTVDPATAFRFFKCSFPNGRYWALNGSLTLGKPIIVDDEIVADSGAATTDEFGGEWDSTGRLIDLASAANNVAGVFQLGGTGAAGSPQRAIGIGIGFMVADDGTIDQGDSLGPGAATAGRMTEASVERTGVALDATAFPTVAGQRFYGRIHVVR